MFREVVLATKAMALRCGVSVWRELAKEVGSLAELAIADGDGQVSELAIQVLSYDITDTDTLRVLEIDEAYLPSDDRITRLIAALLGEARSTAIIEWDTLTLSSVLSWVSWAVSETLLDDFGEIYGNLIMLEENLCFPEGRWMSDDELEPYKADLDETLNRYSAVLVEYGLFQR